MILTGRWAYKKYKKHKAEKEELRNTTQAKHDELLRATQVELSNTAVDRLRTFPSSLSTDEVQRSHSQPPPSYSGIDHAESHSITSPNSTLDTASMTTSTTATTATSASLDSKPHEMLSSEPAQYHRRHPQYQLLSPSQIHLPPGLPPTPAKPLGLNRQPSPGPPAEIQVRGKWVWISEEDAVPASPSSRASQPTPREASVHDGSIAAAAAAVELPVGSSSLPASSPVELPLSSAAQDSDSEKNQARRGFNIAELDSRSVSASDFKKEVRK